MTQENRTSILQMARGAIQERVDYEVGKAVDNILDLNTDPTAKRKITLTIEMKPDENRQYIKISASAKSALAPVLPVGTTLGIAANLVRIDPKKDFPKSITLNGLDSVCKMVTNEAADLFEGDQILIQVQDYRTVRVFTTLDGEMDRCWLYECQADTPKIRVNSYMSHEEAVVQLRSLYIPGPDTEYLLQLLSSISKESKVTSSDNGVTQTVEARQGIALTQSVSVKPRVMLCPFRTFLEVIQPESEFLLRLDNSGNVGLFEADGGVWKLEATRNIAAYFEDKLGELIKAGRVVVLR